MSTQHGPPQLPQVQDEAGDTPNWVPLAGVVFFAVFALAYLAGRADAPDPGHEQEAAAQAEP